MRLEINAGGTINLFERSFEFSEHPNAPGLAFVSDASRARVVRVRRQGDSQPFALKIFKPRFRDSRQLDIAQGLRLFAHVRGMRVAHRHVLRAEEPIVASYPELQYAVLMPWVSERTWFDILVERSRGHIQLTPLQSMRLVTGFLSLMETLEEHRFAHCDISAGNVMINVETGAIELIDLEDAYFPGATRPPQINIGTPGYYHPATVAHGGVWDDMADRHAAAMLVAEMILLSYPSLSANFLPDQGLFADAAIPGSDGARRWQEFLEVSRTMAPLVRDVVLHASRATRLSECPSMADLAAAARLDRSRLPPPQTYEFEQLRRPTPVPALPVPTVPVIPAHRPQGSIAPLVAGLTVLAGIVTLVSWCS